MLNDPTDARFKMLELNLKILKDTEPERYEQSITNIKKWIKKEKPPQERHDKIMTLLN